MKIPKDSLEKALLYAELIRQCTATRNDRFTFYQTLRNYYLFGAMSSQGAPYNKIASTIETLSSFIYSPDTMRFSLHLGTDAPLDDVHKAAPLAKETTEQWRASKTHIVFGLALRWSFVFGITLLKTMWNEGRARSYFVEPHQFGVLREDITELDDQEAFTHHYTITKSQLTSSLEGNPRKESILSRVGNSMAEGLPNLSGGLSRLLLGSAVGNIPGSVALPGGTSGVDGGLAGRGPTYDYTPRVEADLIDMCDLYVWDDAEDDYMCVTRAAPDVVIYDRPASWLGHVKGKPAFTVVRNEFNLYDYFWASSFVAKLAWLQDWRTERTLDVRAVMRKQFDPPWTITGGVGIAEEKLQALRSAGGMVSFPTPNAKASPNAPSMPSDTFAEMNQIDSMFDDQAGLGHVLQGKGEPGVRSRGQADLMARLGSSRPKERAIAAEESAEDCAGLILRLVQDHSDQRFTAPGVKQPDGSELTFIAEQFTRDYEVKVDAHSSSPIFVEDRKHDAITLLEAKAIDRETLLDMFDPPNLQDLKERLKVIEKAEAEQRKAELAREASQPSGGKRK